MIKYNVHHMLVIEEGHLKGIMTNHDLMTLQGISPLSLAKDIANHESIEGLIPVSQKINNIVGLLLKEGAKASNITKVITEINDRLVKKVLEIAEKKFGPAPVPYCLVVFGSEGRKEQTFKMDQHNAVIYADPVSDQQAGDTKRYFGALTAFVRDGLITCGFPLSPADRMASNPLWCQPLTVWKGYFSNWVSSPTPGAVRNTAAFFDLRPIYGEHALSEELKDFFIPLLRDQKVFLGYLANMTVKNTPPVGLFKSFVVDKSGEHKDEFNLKVKGITPLVDSMRLYALEKGIHETSTLERIALLRGRHPLVDEYADELEHAFELLMLLRIHHQYGQISAGALPDNFINPDRLSNFEKKSIREVFQLISKIQGLIVDKYASPVWLRILRTAHGQEENAVSR
jgi:CBS domain-containing protein